MICFALESIGINAITLLHGDGFVEASRVPDYDLTKAIAEGRESIVFGAVREDLAFACDEDAKAFELAREYEAFDLLEIIRALVQQKADGRA